ncbi:hypothetical protein ACOTBX_10490 [Achromobacter xylosoxidans]
MPTTCHNCRKPLSFADIAEIEADPRVAEVARYFGQAACAACCGNAAKHNAKLRAA